MLGICVQIAMDSFVKISMHNDVHAKMIIKLYMYKRRLLTLYCV